MSAESATSVGPGGIARAMARGTRGRKVTLWSIAGLAVLVIALVLLAMITVAKNSGGSVNVPFLGRFTDERSLTGDQVPIMPGEQLPSGRGQRWGP